MLPKVNTFHDLELQLKEEVIFQLLLQQINKDFLLIGIDYQFKSSINANDFTVKLQQIIMELVDTNFELFLNLLYRIDLDETKIVSIITSERDVYSKITFEILKREWKKVWFKLHY